MRRPVLFISAAFVALAVQPSFTQAPSAGRAGAPAAQTNPTQLGNDANGNPLRLATKTGHVSNYDESKVKPYTLPDPLVLADGTRVTTADQWTTERRPEILKLYEDQIYGRVPDNAPTVTWTVADTDPRARNGAAVMSHLVGRMGDKANAPLIHVTLYTPAGVTKPVPVILLVNFGGGTPARGAAPARGRAQQAAGRAGRAGRAGGAGRGGAAFGEPSNAADILAHGWGYATVGYQDIQPDRADAWTEGVIGQTLAPGQTQPGPGEWGTISAWAWGTSRIVDYLAADRAIDASHIAVFGFSRLGKMVLWAAAQDPRISVVISGCAGEMGSALARRDWGETVDDMAQNFPWQFAGNFQQWVGRWNDMPVDAHMLIALSAPRPVFITGGTTDQWSDPKGEFLAEVAAGPVYRLLGKQDLGTTTFPPPDTPVMTGDLAFNEHTGPHQFTPTEWGLAVTFLERYF